MDTDNNGWVLNRIPVSHCRTRNMKTSLEYDFAITSLAYNDVSANRFKSNFNARTQIITCIDKNVPKLPHL